VNEKLLEINPVGTRKMGSVENDLWKLKVRKWM
jgi:hypothetical protein